MHDKIAVYVKYFSSSDTNCLGIMKDRMTEYKTNEHFKYYREMVNERETTMTLIIISYTRIMSQ